MDADAGKQLCIVAQHQCHRLILSHSTSVSARFDIDFVIAPLVDTS